MSIQRMDHVGIVVDDIETATAFFVALGLRLQGEAEVHGDGVDRVIGLEGVRSQIAMLETPDGHSRIRARPRTLRASAISPSPLTTSTPLSPRYGLTARNWWARWSASETTTSSATSAALRGSSSSWPSGSAEGAARVWPALQRRTVGFPRGRRG
jgi:hypothetical protein